MPYRSVRRFMPEGSGMVNTRAGLFRRQLTGYEAFAPKPMPPDPPLRWDADLLAALSEATLAVGRLDGAAASLPNPDLFVAAYVRREAVLSSQIEGTQSSLDDVLAKEVGAQIAAPPDDVAETRTLRSCRRHPIACQTRSGTWRYS